MEIARSRWCFPSCMLFCLWPHLAYGFCGRTHSPVSNFTTAWVQMSYGERNQDEWRGHSWERSATLNSPSPTYINTGDGRRLEKPNPEVSRPVLEAGKARLTTGHVPTGPNPIAENSLSVSKRVAIKFLTQNTPMLSDTTKYFFFKHLNCSLKYLTERRGPFSEFILVQENISFNNGLRSLSFKFPLWF